MKSAVAVLFAYSSLGVAQAKENRDSLVEMCANAQKEVVDDTVGLNIYYQARGKDKKALADQVNGNMTRIINAIKAQYPNADLRGQNYDSSEVGLDTQGKIRGWQITQHYRIQTKNTNDAGAISALVQSNGGVVDDISTFLSPEGARLIQTQLYDEALADVKVRLGAVAKAFGNSVDDWEVAQMNTLPNNQCSSYHQPNVQLYGELNTRKEAVGSIAAPTIVQTKGTQQLAFWIMARLKR